MNAALDSTIGWQEPGLSLTRTTMESSKGRALAGLLGYRVKDE